MAKPVHIPMPTFRNNNAANLHWMEHAHCRNHPDAEQFFPEHDHDRAVRRVVATECNQCPVKEQCFQYGKLIHATSGIWGGVEFGATIRRRRRNNNA